MAKVREGITLVCVSNVGGIRSSGAGIQISDRGQTLRPEGPFPQAQANGLGSGTTHTTSTLKGSFIGAMISKGTNRTYSIETRGGGVNGPFRAASSSIARLPRPLALYVEKLFQTSISEASL
jgi:hypothetical protein